MKKLEKNSLNTLLEIIGTNPSVQVAHFSDGGEELVNALNDYCLKQDGYTYQLNATTEPFYSKMQKEFENSSITKVYNFILKRKSYMIQAREYNFLFVSIEIEDDFMDIFLKRVHKIIRSAGYILLFINKGDINRQDRLIASLEENYFVSTSIIDDMFENYDVIISKKMHGWGNSSS